MLRPAATTPARAVKRSRSRRCGGRAMRRVDCARTARRSSFTPARTLRRSRLNSARRTPASPGRPRPAKRWPAAGVWLSGYWCYDWFDETIRIKSIDAAKRQITLAAAAMYGVKQGNPSPRRFRAINLLEELDEPGEFYIDRAARKLYFWPPAPIAGARIVLSTLNAPLLRIKDAEHVTIRGLTFEAALADAIDVTAGRDVR